MLLPIYVCFDWRKVRESEGNFLQPDLHIQVGAQPDKAKNCLMWPASVCTFFNCIKVHHLCVRTPNCIWLEAAQKWHVFVWEAPLLQQSNRKRRHFNSFSITFVTIEGQYVTKMLEKNLWAKVRRGFFATWLAYSGGSTQTTGQFGFSSSQKEECEEKLCWKLQ